MQTKHQAYTLKETYNWRTKHNMDNQLNHWLSSQRQTCLVINILTIIIIVKFQNKESAANFWMFTKWITFYLWSINRLKFHSRDRYLKTWAISFKLSACRIRGLFETYCVLWLRALSTRTFTSICNCLYNLTLSLRKAV